MPGSFRGRDRAKLRVKYQAHVKSFGPLAYRRDLVRHRSYINDDTTPPERPHRTHPIGASNAGYGSIFSLPIRTMAKRPAEEALEENLYADSPSAKKAKVQLTSEETQRENGDGIYVFGAVSSSNEGYENSQGNGRSVQATNGYSRIISPARSESPDVDDEPPIPAPSRQIAPLEGFSDLYLDTINRSVLDFDFEKLCSVTLSNINVYACLICGKYFQGRGTKSHAYFHALEVGHHVYVNMQTKKVYVLPEGYEVTSKSLEDIKFVVDPRLSKEEVSKLDTKAEDAFDLGGKKYRPGENIPFFLTCMTNGCFQVLLV